MASHRRIPVRLLHLTGGAVLTLAAMTSGAQAQDDDIGEVSQPVVQTVPGGKGMKLNEALSLLARNPQDVSALIEAGRASMEIGDLDAAVGFFQRADRLSPGNPKVMAGLAGAYAQSADPYTAIPLFGEAEKAGPIEPALLSDRGLSYDLVGDNASAQKYYRQALASGSTDETLRRLALSQAISGDRRAMEVTLSPLLLRKDRAAWRTRAFGLAILGQSDEAESIARSNLPQNLADSLAGYLRYMPRLTAAQKAAAANLGHFPRAAEIGIDDPRAAAFQPPRPVLAAAAVPAVPANGKSGRKEKGGKDKSRDRAAAALPQVAATVANPAPSSALAQPAKVALAGNAPAPERVPPPVQVAVARTVSPPSVVASPAAAMPGLPRPSTISTAAASAPVAAGPGFSTLDPAKPNPASTFDLKQVQVTAPPPPPPPSPAPPPPAPALRTRSLADVFADLTPPSREVVASAGAVDIRRLTQTKPAAKDLRDPDCQPASKAARPAKGAKVIKGAKAAKPDQCEVDPKAGKGKSPAASQPSRVWVQVATGRDKGALAFDWRRMIRENGEVLGKSKPFVSAWGQTNRLLTGPFDNENAANAFIVRLKKAGIGGAFVWTSPAGQVVDALVGGK